MALKKEELRKKKLEADLLKKVMKNPTLHPGYHYPASKRTENIITVRFPTVIFNIYSLANSKSLS